MPTAINPQTGERLEYKNGQWVQITPPKTSVPPSGFDVQPPSFGEQLGRQLALTGRHLVEGVTALPSMLAEVPRQLLNLAEPITGVTFPPQQQAVSQTLSDFGFPQPETEQERIVGGASQALAAGAPMLGAGRLLAQTAPATSQLLTATPMAQATSAIAGGGAAPLAEEMGAGPVGQTLAALGAGIAAPATISGLGRFAQSAAERVMTPGAGPRRAAEKMVQRAIQRDLIPEDAVLEAKKLGPEGLMVDVGGPNVRQLAQSVTSVPGKTKAVAEKTLQNRANRSVKRMVADIRKFAGTDKESFQTTKSLIEDRRNVAAPLYKQANEALIDVTDDLSNLVARPTMKKAFRDAVRKAKDDPDWPAEIVIPGKLDEKVPLPVFDYMKRALDDKIGAAIRKGNMDDARIFQGQKQQLLSILDERVPVYAEARQAFSDRSSMLSALETGKKILRSEPDEMMEFLADMTMSEKEMFTVGALKSITDKLKGTVEGANAARRIATDLVKERIRPAFPDDQSFANFVDGLERENVFMQTKGILGGSPTQQRLLSQGQLAGEALEIAASPASGIFNTVRRFVTREKSIPEKVRDEIGEILFSESVVNPKTFSGKTVRRLSQMGVPKSKLQSLLDEINAGTVGAVAVAEE